jgi:phospholipid-translocating ATPase
MEFLGVTGVEDKLQEDVMKTIETLRSAGIQVWMLTGDKVETAKCIAISAGLKEKRQTIFEIKDKTNIHDINQSLNELEVNIHNSMLVIDGQSLGAILGTSSAEERFFEIAKNAPSVCICRCSPT